MDFEPRDSWFETFGKRALTIGAILLCALILYWRSPLSSRFRFRSSFNLRTVSLPNRINTLAEGYPFAVRLKDQVAPKSELEAVTVLLKQHSDRFEPEMLSFYFVPRDSKGRGVMIQLLNESREAYTIEMPAAVTMPSHPERLSLLTSWSSPPPIDVLDAVEIARTNGLKAFTDRAGHDCYLSLMLMSATNRPVWLLYGIGTSKAEMETDFSLSIDAQTGTLTSNTFPQRAWRLPSK